ncbi:MAG TPA: heavy metal-binding domain-containing protein [Flavisolibacter sp.]|jgi:hypothetical protein|nr:heavy metal-binding domain-containing protein [Flavisolibacter sp.]
MKKIAMILLPGATLLACSNEKVHESQNATAARSEAGHEHTFRCPMHPEVTGKEGDTCPKCGMKLERSTNVPTAANAYYMQFITTPSVIEPNKEVILSFTPKKKQAPGEQVPLDIEHEKKIHLILVNDDLSWFDHIHPEYTADGSYQVRANFPAPGKYKAFADYKPTGAGHVVDKIEITVPGSVPAKKNLTAEKLTGHSNNYSFSLTPAGGKFITGPGMHMQGVIRKDGREIDASTLDNYLGAKAHIVVISLEDKEYLHVHPEVAAGRFGIHTTFDKPGIYRGWIQFNADGKLHTIDFTMNVQPGTAAAKSSTVHDHNNAADHSHHSH